MINVYYFEQYDNNYNGHAYDDYREQYRSQIFRRPSLYITNVILFVNLIVWLFMTVMGGSTNPQVLIRFGAKVNALIVLGEYWRLITPVFLHIGLMHLLFNSYALYRLGPLVEILFGNAKFVVIYLISGLGGSILSFVFTQSMSAGASGAIFGLMGALVYFGIKEKELFHRVFGINLYIIIGINLVFGFTVANIDNYGHIGGLLFGFLSAASVGLINNRGIKSEKVIYIIVAAFLMVGSFLYGLNINRYNVYFNYAVERYYSGNYNEAADYANMTLEVRPDDTNAMYILGLVYLKENNKERAFQQFNDIIELNEEFYPAYYMLGIMYIDKGDVPAGVKYLRKALYYNPDLKEAESIINKLEDNIIEDKNAF